MTRHKGDNLHRISVGQPVCKDCVSKANCVDSHAERTDCYKQVTKIDLAIQERKSENLLYMANTPQYAEMLLDKIEAKVIQAKLNTGNSLTQYHIGERDMVIEEMILIGNALELTSYIDIIIYLKNVVNGKTN